MSNWQERIHGYADGECDAAEKASVEAHIATDPKAANELKWARSLRGLVAGQCKTEACSETWSKAISRLDAIDKTKRTEGVVAKFGWAFCGVFMVAIVAAGITNKTIGGRVLNGTQMSSIFDSLRPVSQPTVSSTDRMRVQLLADSPFVSVPVGMALVDARAGGYNGKAVESLTFRDHDGLLSLMMVAGLDKVEGIAPAPFGDKYSTGFFNGRMCATWKQGSYTVLLMGDRSAEELKAMAHRLVPEDGVPSGR